MQYLFMAFFAVAVVVADQLSKYWVVHHIALDSNVMSHWPVLQSAFHLPDSSLTELPQKIKAIPGVFCLSHTLNDGAVFSSFRGMRWAFVAIFAVFAVFIIWEFPKKRWPLTNFERWCIVAVFAGGLGNVIDRVRFGFVIDMIELEFMRFAVFNVADCFITCGSILLMAHLILFNKGFWKEDKKK